MSDDKFIIIKIMDNRRLTDGDTIRMIPNEIFQRLRIEQIIMGRTGTISIDRHDQRFL